MSILSRLHRMITTNPARRLARETVGGSSPDLDAVPKMPSTPPGSGQHKRLASRALDRLSSITSASDFGPEHQALLMRFRLGETYSDLRAPDSGAFTSIATEG